MQTVVDDSPELRADALEEELDSALRKLLAALVLGKDPNELAWWLCANHGMFLVNYRGAPLLPEARYRQVVEMAKQAGTPPSSTLTTWEAWFAHLHDLRDKRR